MMTPAPFVQPMTVQGFPGPNSRIQALPPGTAGNWVSPPSPPAGTQYAQQSPPLELGNLQPQPALEPRIRFQAPDDPPVSPRPAQPDVRTAALHMPSPEELGIGSASPAATPTLDWGAVHSRLNQLGATCFLVQRTAQGSYRISCLLPAGQSGRAHRIEAEAGAEAEAVRLALTRVEEWAGGRPSPNTSAQ
jgi:hypothetical protein